MLETLVICRAAQDSRSKAPARIFYPFLIGERKFQQLGARIRYQYDTALRSVADVAVVDCKLFYGKPKCETLQFLQDLRRRAARVIWLDNRDSAGNTQFEVLPYVDVYSKSQLYRERTNYDQAFAGNRMHTDYFAKLFKLAIPPVEQDEPLSAYAEHSRKLTVGWNTGFGNYLPPQSLRSLVSTRILKVSTLPKFIDPRTPRTIDVNARFSLGTAPAYSAHRQAVLDKLATGSFKRTPTNKVSKKQFVRELQNSKIVISPFGWGEVCYRDFEATINGCCVVKPAMEHLVTWPDIYRARETYQPTSWDLGDLQETTSALLADDERRIDMVLKAQEALRQVYSSQGLTDFCRDQYELWKRPL